MGEAEGKVPAQLPLPQLPSRPQLLSYGLLGHNTELLSLWKQEFGLGESGGRVRMNWQLHRHVSVHECVCPCMSVSVCA